MFLRKKKTEKHACCEVQPHSDLTSVEKTCSDEAYTTPAGEVDPSRCPVSNTIGRKVDLVTVKALLNAKALRRLDGRAYRYCPEVGCDVVYFDNAAGSRFQKDDLTVRVGQKENGDSSLVCYCFNFTVGDLRQDLVTRGKTDIPSTITAEVRAGHCACEVKNPQGTCCLGNVMKAVEHIEAGLSVLSK